MQTRTWVRALAGTALGAVLSWPASAATIFGTITQSGKPVANAELTLGCAGLATPVKTQTDGRGTYHFSLTTKGSCKLSFQSGSVQAQADVIVDPNPTQYDFDVVTSAAGARLVRK